MTKFVRSLFLPCLIFLGFTCALSSRADIKYAGVNLSGAEFGSKLPGTFNTDFFYPTTAEVDYYQGRGMNIIRLPFRWERLQRTNLVALDTAELGRLTAFVSYATSNGMYVILDPHNYERYYPPSVNNSSSTQIIGGAQVPDSWFTDFWSRVATVFQTNNHVIFGLMNEPNTMPEAQMVTSENAAIAAIRATGATNLIFVPGNRWTGAWTWLNADGNGAANSVAMLGIVDPGSNYVFEVHQYLDSDGSGTKTNIVSADIGWQRLTNFTAWARANNVKGFLGEYAVPGAAIVATGIGGSALTNMLSYIQTNSDVWLGWTYWGGGPRWGSTPLFPIDPLNISNPIDRPVMPIIKNFFPFPVPILQLVNGNQVQFTAPPGFMYQPQISTDLINWTSFGPVITGSVQAATVNISGSSSQEFYRVQVSPAP
jgi:endoglucanase